MATQIRKPVTVQPRKTVVVPAVVSGKPVEDIVWTALPNGVLKASAARTAPVIVLAGSIGSEGYELIDHGAAAVLAITDRPMSLTEAKERAGELLCRTAESAMRLVQVGLGLSG